MFPVKILMKRNRTDWLLMVISGNNLMINFMAAMVRWQALSDLYREKYSSPHLRLHPGAEVYH